MRIMKHNDEIIRQVETFKKYSDEMSEIISEDYAEVKGHGLEKPLFCGVFVAKIFLMKNGHCNPIGTYRFDCRHYRNFMQLDRLAPKLTRLN